MTVRLRPRWLAALLGLAFVPGPAWSAEPAPLPPAVAASPSQALADAVAGQLKQSGRLRGYTVHVSVRGSAVELTGSVADQAQREEALRVAQAVPGVESVRDRLTVPAGAAVVRVDAPAPQTAQPPTRLPEPVPEPKPTPPGAGAAGAAEPVPLFRAPGPGYADLNPPKMPPYAWPTYAPYNNYSRVAYPNAYPYNAFPFIGPFYPFPKVPLGWRSVKLEWDDGYWWFSKVGHKYNWWRIRFW